MNLFAFPKSQQCLAVFLVVASGFLAPTCCAQKATVDGKDFPELTIRCLPADEPVKQMSGTSMETELWCRGVVGNHPKWIVATLESKHILGPQDLNDPYSDPPHELVESAILMIDIETRARILISQVKKANQQPLPLSWERDCYGNAISIRATPRLIEDDETPEKVFVWKFRLDDMSLEEIGKMNQRRAELIRVFDPSIFEIVDVVEAGKTISYSICRKQHSEFGSAETIMLDAEFEVSGSYQHFPKQTIQIVDAREPKLLVARFEDPIANLECFSLKPEIKSLWKLNRRDLLCMLGSPNAPFVSGLCVDNSSNSERTDFGVFLNYADIMGMYYKGEKSGKDINKTAFKTMFLVLDVETARVLQRVPLGSGEPFCDPLNRSFRGEWLYLHPVVPSFPYEWPPSRFCQRVVNLRTGEIFDNAGDDVSAIPEYFAINDDGTAFRCDGQVIYRVDCKRVFVEEEIFRLEAPAQ